MPKVCSPIIQALYKMWYVMRDVIEKQSKKLSDFLLCISATDLKSCQPTILVLGKFAYLSVSVSSTIREKTILALQVVFP